MNSIFKQQATPEFINQNLVTNMIANVGIEFLEIGQDYLKARMPVNEKTTQTFGILHGGASVVLAETVGSIGANLAVEEEYFCVGLEVNANHLRTVRSGYVYALARPLHIGKAIQVWDIRITDDNHKLVCISRLTMAVRHKIKDALH
ncbi:MAG: hotdog fold thioesterase [Bacteroidia bacterium]|nr:hotdog fold thioesterase [Bacteroidia bacterium]MDW8159358.1 hotdog fold thioesterase [Bacteroidia bacterium]